jgi:hypothetical protein
VLGGRRPHTVYTIPCTVQRVGTIAEEQLEVCFRNNDFSSVWYHHPLFVRAYVVDKLVQVGRYRRSLIPVAIYKPYAYRGGIIH